VVGNGTVFKLTPPSSTGGIWSETLLHSFDASGNGGCAPVAGVIADASGALYGTTAGGGAGEGTVFMLTPPSTAGGPSTPTVLHTFSGTDGPSPVNPIGLMFDSSGALNGTTVSGSSQNGGTVFNMPPLNPSAFATLYSFTPLLPDWTGDGNQPSSGLIADASGALYGTTANGGQSGGGAIFKLTPPSVPRGAWTETLPYSFTGGNDGQAPMGNLLHRFGASGALFGTAFIGGQYGVGTVFQLTPPSAPGAGWHEIPIYSFTGGSDGMFPQGGLIADASGALYGTTVNGGDPVANAGVIFKLTPPSTASGSWNLTVLHTFGADGAYSSALVSDASGALYGTSPYGGVNGTGSVFKLTTPAKFFPAPGSSNCGGQSTSTLSNTYGTLLAAAKALGYPNVKALQAAIASYCGG
jgi:uncharacterized repeat protein (TIGR03803 family)